MFALGFYDSCIIIINRNIISDYWEILFEKEGNAWGWQPSQSSELVSSDFKSNAVSDILITGIGYGRNAVPFLKRGIKVTGIEISSSAIKIAKDKQLNINFHRGSVLDMPFDDKLYQGLFSYSLLHLFNNKERNKILQLSYDALLPSGIMYFVVVSTTTEMYGEGEKLSNDYFKLNNGLKVFFYNSKSIEKEFSDFGLVDYWLIDEPITHIQNVKPLKCYMIKCIKPSGQLKY